MLNSFYAGTIEHLMELARAVGFTAVSLWSENAVGISYGASADGLCLVFDIPGRTREKEETPQERSSTYKFKGNVQKRGIVVGSGQETVVDSVSYPVSQAVDDLYHPCPASQANLMGVNMPRSPEAEKTPSSQVLVQAPNKEAAKREIKTVRHVMIDGVRRKATTETSKPAQAVEGKQPEKKQQKDQKEEKQQEQKEQTQQSSTKPPPSGKSQQGPAPQQQAGGSWWSLLGGGNLTSGNLQGASDVSSGPKFNRMEQVSAGAGLEQ
ncbi:unnamed protein product [Heligmosomoides polygyrus]|uniref:WD_REPEATS_REGION domain-containing protein n=1 Tax=Heligmosomoides polygyrus TaxID=6339 RepID=A0A183FAL8_HELPZ|nr:unnamed protein product [Heligmosomoides polygyrus]